MTGHMQPLTVDRGQKARVVLCADELDPNFLLTGLENSEIKIDYVQHLARCNLQEDSPGLYLILSPGERAHSTRLDVASKANSSRVFASLSIEVPDRFLLPNTSLTEIGRHEQRMFTLEVPSDGTLDFSGVRAEDITFPEGPWPEFELLVEDDMAELQGQTRSIDRPIAAERNRLTMLVRVNGEQRQPGKVVIRNVLDDGVSVEAVAHVSLPEPAWALSMAPDTAKFINVDGVRTRYFEKGDGTPLLLVHGGQAGSAGFAAWSWLPNFDALAKDFRVIALDRIGQGYTDNPKGDADYENYYQTVVDHVFGFIGALNLEAVHLVGHSQGGWPVTRVALDHPHLVKSLTIVDSATAAPADPEGGSVQFYGYISRFIHPSDGETKESVLRELNMYSYTGNNITEAQIKRLLELAELPKMAEARSQLIKHRMNPAHPTYRILKAALHEDIEDGKLKVPTLIVWGRNDPEGSYGSGIKLYELMSAHADDVAFYTFENAGHLPSKEYPDEFNWLLTSFARKHS